jgi:hypothetical protein
VCEFYHEDPYIEVEGASTDLISRFGGDGCPGGHPRVTPMFYKNKILLT